MGRTRNFVVLEPHMDAPEINSLYQKIGGRIRLLRKKQGFNQEQLGTLVGLSRTSIVNIESGKQHPTVHFLFDIARKFGVGVEELFPNTLNELDRKARSLEEHDRKAFQELLTALKK